MYKRQIKALLRALLEPTEVLMKMELAGDCTSRLTMLEELKSYPFAAIWDYYSEAMGLSLIHISIAPFFVLSLSGNTSILQPAG